MSDPDDLSEMLTVCFELYKGQAALIDALRVALRVGDGEKVAEVMAAAEDATLKKQVSGIWSHTRAHYPPPTPLASILNLTCLHSWG